MKYLIGGTIFSLASFLIAPHAHATIWECHTTQVFHWEHGKIKPVPTSKARSDAYLSFSDDLGELVESRDPHPSFAGGGLVHMKILAPKPGEGFDVVAIDQQGPNIFILRLSPWRKPPTFEFDIDGTDRVAGICAKWQLGEP
jgi:hypothetical protein